MSAQADSRTIAGSQRDTPHRVVGVWLLLVALLVVAMVMLGGATRLTNSGLSMVHWHFAGSLPPLDDAAWQQEFARYQQFPEYRKLNVGMELPAFKRIFWFEYSHRMLGRLIGMAFALPMLWFLLRGQLRRPLLGRLVGLLLLGGLQGLVGWWMVRSGLVDHPDVSHYRLTVHLGLATALFAALLWVGTGELGHRQTPAAGAAGGKLVVFGWLVCALVFAQILLGGLVAGLNAGLVYNSFPTMGGHWIPPEVSTVALGGLLDEPVAVQFLHRLGAYAVIAAVLVLWLAIRRGNRSGNPPSATILVLLALSLQVGLGIATLLLAVPLHLALAHQAGALLLLAALLLQQRALLSAPRRSAGVGL